MPAASVPAAMLVPDVVMVALLLRIRSHVVKAGKGRHPCTAIPLGRFGIAPIVTRACAAPQQSSGTSSEGHYTTLILGSVRSISKARLLHRTECAAEELGPLLPATN